MYIAIFVLGILYLNGFSVGTALAICAIVEGGLIFLTHLFERLKIKLKNIKRG